MGIRKIVTIGDDTLRKHCKPQEKFDKRLSVLLKDMAETMYKAEGVGLAAPQVGHNVRMLVISYATGNEEKPLVQLQLANPRIVVNSVKKAFLSGGEGCLSVDQEHAGRVYRDYKIVIEAYDCAAKRPTSITAKGYDAIVLQHEIDHLNGVLFYDHIDKTNPNKVIPGAVEI